MIKEALSIAKTLIETENTSIYDFTKHSSPELKTFATWVKVLEKESPSAAMALYTAIWERAGREHYAQWFREFPIVGYNDIAVSELATLDTIDGSTFKEEAEAALDENTLPWLTSAPKGIRYNHTFIYSGMRQLDDIESFIVKWEEIRKARIEKEKTLEPQKEGEPYDPEKSLLSESRMLQDYLINEASHETLKTHLQITQTVIRNNDIGFFRKTLMDEIHVEVKVLESQILGLMFHQKLKSKEDYPIEALHYAICHSDNPNKGKTATNVALIGNSLKQNEFPDAATFQCFNAFGAELTLKTACKVEEIMPSLINDSQTTRNTPSI